VSRPRPGCLTRRFAETSSTGEAHRQSTRRRCQWCSARQRSNRSVRPRHRGSAARVARLLTLVRGSEQKDGEGRNENAQKRQQLSLSR
jgi:hypothetical protein